MKKIIFFFLIFFTIEMQGQDNTSICDSILLQKIDLTKTVVDYEEEFSLLADCGQINLASAMDFFPLALEVTLIDNDTPTFQDVFYLLKNDSTGANVDTLLQIPPPSFSNKFFNLSDSLFTPFFTTAKDYDDAINQAQQSGKPILIYFSGFGCVNAKKMEEYFFIDPDVQKFGKNKIEVITLMADDQTPLPTPFRSDDGYRKRMIKTIGQKNVDFQIKNFRNNSQPFLVFIDKDRKELISISYVIQMKEVKEFLNKGLRMHYGDQYKKE